MLRTADQTGPEISLAGLADFGRPYDGNDKRRENHYELADVASLAKGRHLVSFGGDLDLIRENVSAYDGFAAVYIFPTLNAFLNGRARSVSTSIRKPQHSVRNAQVLRFRPGSLDSHQPPYDRRGHPLRF